MINQKGNVLCCNEVFLYVYRNALERFGDVVNGLIRSKTEDNDEIEKMAWHVIEVLNMDRDGNGALSLLNNVRWKDTDTFIHSVNVAMLCYDIAKWAGLDKAKREEAALCGLLHDVGKLTVPEKVLKKPGLLTNEERDEIKKHTLQGFDALLFLGMRTYVWLHCSITKGTMEAVIRSVWWRRKSIPLRRLFPLPMFMML